MNTDLMAIGQFVGDQENFMNAIIESKGGNLPVKVEQVLSIFEFTDFKAKAWKILADKMKKLEDHSEAHNSALRSGQKWGIAALYAQKRMGEITRDIPRSKTNEYGGVLTHGNERKATLKAREWKDSEQLANNPEILERVIGEAKESGDIPTKSTVLRAVKEKNDQERQSRYSESVKENKKEMDQMKSTAPIAVSIYLNKLDEVLLRLPINPPSDGWDDNTIRIASGKANIILKRIGKFLDPKIQELAEINLRKLGIKELEESNE